MATKKDFTQVAHAVSMQATGAAPKRLSRLPSSLPDAKGGLKGGKARMDKLTDEQRTALAFKGVAGRKKAPADEAGARLAKK